MNREKSFSPDGEGFFTAFSGYFIIFLQIRSILFIKNVPEALDNQSEIWYHNFTFKE